jgi:hypothetical protein
MKWIVDAERREAMTAEGYLITWAENSMGTFFNGWAPRVAHKAERKHIEASYDREKVKAACEAHLVSRESTGEAA